MISQRLWETEEEEFDKLSVLSNISRYNTRYRIKNESVAAHSFYVVYFTSVICGEFKLPPHITQLAMEVALVHDIPEIYLNDITYDCKQLIPGLNELLQPHEEHIISKISEVSAKILFKPDSLEEKLIKSIVRYADVVSVKQYAFSEMKLGNKSFKEILDGAEKRINELSDELSSLLQRYDQTREIEKYFK